ncbi:hypothetical protein C8A05DRAFT_18217 [Staphylotrichum tortipilum]|uniref:PPPDE domain-containing protein n=1 Tax=Staphylotrichum tortipilum TaxID=2831512 RepID=A0AAN6RRC6_9PEZI|nr:hypothetical protein C8A05DRAFT_18217 [Staphylotrichum longicolle]
MSDSDTGSDKSGGKRKKIKSLFKSSLTLTQTSLHQTRHALEHTLGLGPKPNAIPPGEPLYTCPPRPVLIGWHPVAGTAGKWFAERTRLGHWITEKVSRYPDPSQHWAVLVGDYCHELWMDERLDVIYNNGPVAAETWRTFPVGETRLNDEALRRAGEDVIAQMRAKKPGYNLISNNCQNFALELLEAIQVRHAERTEFATTLAVVQTATGSGKVRDLFRERTPSEVAREVVENEEGGIVGLARRLMEEHTRKLENTAGHGA